MDGKADTPKAFDFLTKEPQPQTICDNFPAAPVPDHRAQIPAGTRLGKYTITTLLGAGGMGEVYRAFDPVIERDVALKVLPSVFAARPGTMQRFLAEARAVGKLNHPNIVGLYEIGSEIIRSDSVQFLVMEFVPGGSLYDLLKGGGRIGWQRATRFMAEVCQGLAAAHTLGLLHRDIKPENLLRTTDDHVKITDFGLTKAIDDAAQPAGLTKPGELLGTPTYMSPEQFNGSQVDQRTDIYSAGVTYYQLLTGRRPFEEAPTIWQVMFAHCHNPVPDPRMVSPDLPHGCSAVLQKSMAKRPEDRYQTAAEMHAALVALLSPAAAGVSQTGPAPVTSAEASDARPDAPDLSGLTFWVVEPSRVQGKILQRLLADLGGTSVRVFHTASEAISAYGTARPDVVISAMHLDDATGNDLAAAVRELSGGPEVRFLVVSSSSAIPVPNPAGPVVLPKPVTKELILQALRG